MGPRGLRSSTHEAPRVEPMLGAQVFLCRPGVGKAHHPSQENVPLDLPLPG